MPKKFVWVWSWGALVDMETHTSGISMFAVVKEESLQLVEQQSSSKNFTPTSHAPAR
jgi:hypothetical protein